MPFRFNASVFYFMLYFIITVVVSPLSELVCYTPDLSLCGALVPLDINLDGFSGILSTIIGILSIDPEFLLILEELLKRALCIIHSGYYPVFGPQTSIFSFVYR